MALALRCAAAVAVMVVAVLTVAPAPVSGVSSGAKLRARFPKMEPYIHDTKANAVDGATWFTDRRHTFNPVTRVPVPHRCELVAAEVRTPKPAGDGEGGGGGGGSDAESLFVELATQLSAQDAALADAHAHANTHARDDDGDGDAGGDLSSPMGALKHIAHYTGLDGAFSDEAKGGARGWLHFPARIEKKHPGTQFWSCVDARSPYAVLGTPGGDLGEFILAFAAAEYVNPKQLYTVEMVNDLFQEFMYRMQSFGKRYVYLHTDEAAESALKSAAGVRAAKRPATGEERNALLDAVIKPENVGCQHLKAMLSDPTGYHVRKELAQAFIQVFHNVLYDTWNPLHKHLLYVTLKGEPVKSPGFHVYTPHVCKLHEAPILVPNTADAIVLADREFGYPAAKKGGTKAWIYHHNHVVYWRNVLAAFLVLHDSKLTMVQLSDRMKFLAAEHDKKLNDVYGSPAYDLIFA